MLGSFTRFWWVFLLRGIAAIIFGVTAYMWPGPTLVALVLLFGAYLLVDGTVNLISLVAGDRTARRHGWAVLLNGILSIALGVAAFVWTDTFALSLLYVIAFWAIVTGTLEIVAAISLRREIRGEGWMVLSGFATVVFGALLIVFPGPGMLSLVWLIALWAIVFGVGNIALSYRLHQYQGSRRGTAVTA